MREKNIKISKIIICIILSLLVVVYIAPLVWVFIVSLKEDTEFIASPFGLPSVCRWKYYKVAWFDAKLNRATINSFLVCSITLIVSIVIGSMAAFAIARMKWKLSSLTLTYFLIGMMVPIHCVLIPLFTKFAKMGLTNTLTGLIIPYITISLPMTIFLMTGFFRGMPSDLFEAACIDGCSIYGCFGKIALPLARVGFFVTGLMTFVMNWNELLLAMVFISDPLKKTIPVTLTFFVGPHETNYCQMFAAIVVAVAPTIIVYSLFSNQIVDGLTQGAVKG